MQKILQLFFELTSNPVYLIDDKQCLYALPQNPLNQLKPHILTTLLSYDAQQKYQVFYLENYYYIVVLSPQQQLAVFKSQHELIDERFNSEIKLFYYLIWQQFLNAKKLPPKNFSPELITLAKEHKTSKDERRMLLAISQGQSQTFSHLHQQFWLKTGQFGTLDTQSNLRNQKNLAIAWITLITRAAINGGVPDETAYQLSDTLIQQLEQKKQLNLQEFNQEAGQLFIQLVVKNQLGELSADIKAVCLYLQTNYAKKITLDYLSQHFCVSKGHLQRKFKQETNLTIIAYLDKQRLIKAGELLSYTPLPVTQVAAQVGFESVSYFIKLFQKNYGLTPLKWRQQQYNE